MHSCGILHRDLKTDNALIKSVDPLVVKWGDYGCAVKLGTNRFGDGASRWPLALTCPTLSVSVTSLCAFAFKCLCTVADHTYTQMKGPIAWMAPETFDEREHGGIVSPATDVYMLGSCFVELATGCERTPFDWLTGHRVLLFRGNDSTRAIDCIQVLPVSARITTFLIPATCSVHIGIVLNNCCAV